MPEQLQLSKPAASVDIATGTKARITAVRKVPGKLTPEQDAVLALLEAAHAPDARLSQRDIARSAAWLGCHPKHEAEVVANEFESTTRQVRDIIRQLRIEHQIPVLSDREGYFLPSFQLEADTFIKRMELEAKARAAASMVTYNVMKHTLGVTSAFFEAIAAVDAPKAEAAASGSLQTGKADLADRIAKNIDGAMQRAGYAWPLYQTAELFRQAMNPDSSGAAAAKHALQAMLNRCDLKFEDVVRDAGGVA